MRERIDFGVKVSGEKAERPDDFVTKSQLVTPDGNALETLANGDLVVPAATSDHLVLADVGDATAGTLIDKIFSSDNSVYIATDNSDPDNIMLDLTVVDSGGGLPTATEGQMLRKSTTDWAATSQIEIQNNDTEVRIKTDQCAIYGGVVSGDHQKILESTYRVTPYNFIRLFALGMLFEKNLSTGAITHYVKSDTDNTGKYLQIANNDGLVDFVDAPEGGGLPDGTETGQLARWDGADWVAVPEAKIITGSGNASMILKNTRAALVLDCDTYNTGDVAIAVLGGGLYRFTVLQNGQIKAAALAGTGNRPVIADASGNMSAPAGASGAFTTADGKTVTVTNGIITSIV